ncbi:hypothetical protein BYT27DRAFT_7206816 [Phlegmacium glaucopus]|nr:hypothetical protein BYT27DRAFT_7206816 [Phlegmacium glaucopus]
MAQNDSTRCLRRTWNQNTYEDPLQSVNGVIKTKGNEFHPTSVDATDCCNNPHQDHIYDIDTNMVDDLTRQDPLSATPDGSGEVARATCSARTPTVERVEYNPEESNSARTETESLTHTDVNWTPPLISERISSAPLGLDRSHSDPTTAMKPNIALKLSRRAFNVGCADKMPAFHPDDAHEHAKSLSLGHDETTPPPIKSAHSPKHQHFRPLRRKNHLHIMPPNPDSEASEPIAISLTLHHSPPSTSSHLSKKSSQILTDYVSPHPHTRAHSHPQSTASTGTADPVTPPMTPTHQRSLPSSAPPKMKSAGTTGSSSPQLSPVRLGHPSRPYYNAIRKNGISTPPSRARPQSQPSLPPSSFHLGFDLTPAVATPEPTSNSSRHLSMSAMLASPTPFSAFSIVDDNDDDDNDDNGDFEVHSGPTNSARLSLSSSLHRLSYNSHTHNAQSISRARGINGNNSSGFGCSMSGETELRMALATSSPSGVPTLGRTEDGFRFRETVIPSESVSNVDYTNAKTGYIDTRGVGSRDSLMGRVKKLRKGLKEMLMNKNTTTTPAATT